MSSRKRMHALSQGLLTVVFINILAFVAEDNVGVHRIHREDDIESLTGFQGSCLCALIQGIPTYDVPGGITPFKQFSDIAQGLLTEILRLIFEWNLIIDALKKVDGYICQGAGRYYTLYNTSVLKRS